MKKLQPKKKEAFKDSYETIHILCITQWYFRISYHKRILIFLPVCRRVPKQQRINSQSLFLHFVYPDNGLLCFQHLTYCGKEGCWFFANPLVEFQKLILFFFQNGKGHSQLFNLTQHAV